MRVLVTGATGNVGTALLRRLVDEPDVEVHGIARRAPELVPPYDHVVWHTVDLADPGDAPTLVAAMSGTDAVVHLAWQIQPSHDEASMRRTNVDGTGRVVEAAAAAGVGHLVHISSLGAYAPGPQDEAVDESWPVTGVRSSAYSRHKADAEALLDSAESRHRDLRVARVRPGLVMQRDAGSEIGRYFLGGLVPKGWVGRLPLPILPLPRLVGQVVHADDLAEALTLILRQGATGAYNVATDPPITEQDIGRAFRAGRVVRVPWAAVRATAGLTWRARLQPTSEGWVDLGRYSPLMSTARARTELGWRPRVSATDALQDLVDGMGHGAGVESPPLEPRAG